MEAEQSARHYRLVEKPDEGGVGVVWKATGTTTLDRCGAVGFLLAHRSEDAGALARLVVAAEGGSHADSSSYVVEGLN